jgi:hypothetical protein
MEGEGCLEDNAKPKLDLVDVHMFKTIVIESNGKCHNFFYNCFFIVIMFRQLLILHVRTIWVFPL